MATTGDQFIEVLEILDELNAQAQRLQRAAVAAKLYLSSEQPTTKEAEPHDDEPRG